jgi:hypothetical protein
MPKRKEDRRQYTFTLYEDNEKDMEVIKFLEKIPIPVRGKTIRSWVLKIFDEPNDGGVYAEPVKVVKQQSNDDTVAGIGNKNKGSNPFDNLNL